MTQPVDETEAFIAALVAADTLASQTADAQPHTPLLPAATNIPTQTLVATTENQAVLAHIFASATAAMIQAQSIRPTVRPSATRSNPTALPTMRPVGMTMYISDGGVRA